MERGLGIIFCLMFFSRTSAYGPGIEPTGPIINAPANFTVETFSAGKGNVEVTVEDPRGTSLPVCKMMKMLYGFSSTNKAKCPSYGTGGH